MKKIQDISVVFALIFAALALGTSMYPSASEVYKSVDENGKVLFTDQSTPETKPVDLQKTNIVPPPADTPASVQQSNTIGSKPDYSVIITSPKDQQLFPNRLTPFKVITEVTPKLTRGQQLRLLIDRTPHSTSQGSFTVLSLGLGEHSLHVEIITPDKEVIGRSETITIFSRQPG